MDMQRRVNELLHSLQSLGVKVRSLAADSRAVSVGDVFLAFPGELNDGRQYIDAALRAGAVAVVYEAAGHGVGALSVPQLAVSDLRALTPYLAAEVYGHPACTLSLVGVTGTNGKTSVTQWLAQASQQLQRPCAIVGTLGNGFPGALEPSPNTTPNALMLQQQLRRFVAAGAVSAAVEVSSIGIEEGRIDATEFSVAVFTNFTRDHLDYHGSIEAYAEAKARLFSWPGLKAAVINLDDPFGIELVRRIGGRIPCIGYSLNIVRVPVDELLLDEILVATNLQVTPTGVRFDLNGQRCEFGVVGRFNAANLLAVIGTLRAQGVALDDAVKACATLAPPPGRMQTFGGVDAPLVVVDYAHTPDALEKVLQTLREVSHARGGQLHCVFGCGGDRDAGKRPIMGATAEREADQVTVTSDNSRSEDPAAIIDAIVAGMKRAPHIEPDREQAIRQAIACAANVDVVLLAGKGHEDYQEIGSQRLPFSDLLLAQQSLEARAC